jgi:hypothetical protein
MNDCGMEPRAGHRKKLVRGQGDQIGRFFVHWVIVYFWEFFLKIAEVARNFWVPYFHQGCRMVCFPKILIWANFEGLWNGKGW